MRYAEGIEFSRQRPSIIHLVAETRSALCRRANVEQGSSLSLSPLRPSRSRSVQVAIQYPAAVTACNVDLETLITDSNRSIATLAITTLLKVNFLLSNRRKK